MCCDIVMRASVISSDGRRCLEQIVIHVSLSLHNHHHFLLIRKVRYVSISNASLALFVFCSAGGFSVQILHLRWQYIRLRRYSLLHCILSIPILHLWTHIHNPTRKEADFPHAVITAPRTACRYSLRRRPQRDPCPTSLNRPE
jgi:hypothetical protein